MSEPLTAKLRVFVQMSDGRIAGYAWDTILSASQLRDELAEAGTMASDDDEFIYRPASDWPECVRQVFEQTRSWVSVADRGDEAVQATGQGALL